jgi:hypothetical protein
VADVPQQIVTYLLTGSALALLAFAFNFRRKDAADSRDDASKSIAAGESNVNTAMSLRDSALLENEKLKAEIELMTHEIAALRAQVRKLGGEPVAAT